MELRQAYKSQKEYHDRHTSRMLFAPGEKVWLSAKNIRTTRPCKKLDYKRHGPFTVLKAVGRQAYRLDLPKTMKIYPVFHVSLLEPYKGSNDDEEPPPPILQDDMAEYEVEQVLDSRFTRGKLQYRVAWTGYPDAFNEWLDASAVVNAPELVTEFYKAYPTKPGPDKAAQGLPQAAAELPKPPKRRRQWL